MARMVSCERAYLFSKASPTKMMEAIATTLAMGALANINSIITGINNIANTLFTKNTLNKYSSTYCSISNKFPSILRNIYLTPYTSTNPINNTNMIIKALQPRMVKDGLNV